MYRELYARSGLLSKPLQDMLAPPGLPRMSSWIERLAPAGVSEASVLTAVGSLYVLSLLALLLGSWTRLSAVLTWFLRLTLQTSGNGTNYGADWLASIFLFYLLWFPSGAALSLDRLRGRVRGGPSPTARLALRVVQLHLCILYFTSGVAKAQSHAWWSGDAIWLSVMTPEYRQLDFSWLATHSWVAVAAGWAVLLVETGYPALIWPRPTRRLWVAATVSLHLGIAVFMGLTVFGAVMIVFTVAAFGVSAEPRAATSAKLTHMVSVRDNYAVLKELYTLGADPTVSLDAARTQGTIFSPLDLAHTSWRLSDFTPEELVLPYRWNGSSYVSYGQYSFADYPNGGLRTTAPDLARFVAMLSAGGELAGHRILNADTVASIFEVQRPEIDATQGLGFYQVALHGEDWVGHSGAESGVVTEMFLRPADGLGFVLLMNGDWGRDPAPIEALEEAIIHFGEELEPNADPA